MGGGALWETVDKEAIKHGLATVARTVNHVSPSFVVDEACSNFGDRLVLEGSFCFASFPDYLTVIISLTLGGGYGWLTGRHGLAIDNLVQVRSPISRNAPIPTFNPSQATIVTASGSIVTTSTTSHPDLFFAIRGGGSNFGVLTEFVFKLHPQRPTIYGGHLIFAPPALEKIVDVTKEWWANVGEDEAMLKARYRLAGWQRTL